jgi:hypothetical protein
MSPFLFNPAGFSLPGLLQSMVARAQAGRPPGPLLSPPGPRGPPDKAELLRVNSDSLGHYAAFRQNMLQQLKQKKSVSRRNSSDSGSEAGSSADSSLLLASPSDTQDAAREQRDHAYWERRRKNNLAAKRSRDARRAKEDEIAIRAAFLEQENVQLKWEVTRLTSETGQLRALLMADSEPECELRELTQS